MVNETEAPSLQQQQRLFPPEIRTREKNESCLFNAGEFLSSVVTSSGGQTDGPVEDVARRVVGLGGPYCWATKKLAGANWRGKNRTILGGDRTNRGSSRSSQSNAYGAKGGGLLAL